MSLIRIQLLLCLCLSVGFATSTSSAVERPNVVILLADDLGSKDIGCYGGPVKTPALDDLAARGVRFTDFHSGAPVCSPSRATLLTGRQHLRTGVYTVIQDHLHDMHLLKSEVTIAEVLKANGYDTAHIGKWHLGTPFRGRKKPWINEHGFDYWFATDLNAAPSHRNPTNFWRNGKRVGELKGYACQIVVDDAINWLNKRESKKPFFLNIWFHEPHAPLAAPDDIVSQYGKLGDPAAIYSATIDNTDRAISRLVKRLKESGELDNTIIVYTSDHGSYMKDRNGGLKGNKGSLFEGGILTPGIFFWPKGIKGKRVESAASGAVDLLPTLCGLIGIDKPKGVHLDGADLSPLLTGKREAFKRDQPLFWHSPGNMQNVALRDGNYTLMGFRKDEPPRDWQAINTIVKQFEAILEKRLGRQLTRGEVWHRIYNTEFKSAEDRKLRNSFVMLNTFSESWIPAIKAGLGGFRTFELYDLSTDPQQKKNIAAQYPKVVERLEKQALAINDSVLKEARDWTVGSALAAATPKPRTKSPSPPAFTATIKGKVTDKLGTGMGGVMVTAVDEAHRRWSSVFSQADGSFVINDLRTTDHKVRARLMGQLDVWLDKVSVGTTNLDIEMKPATGMELEVQRPANSGFSMLKFDNMRDKENYKMMCTYCHQSGTVPFRTPEKPVDWETMLTRMDGFGGLYPHTRKTIVQRLVDTYKDDAVLKWPKFVPPPPPSGLAAKAKITSWEIGEQYEGSFHDLELGPDGLVYLVNIQRNRTVTLDPVTGEQRAYQVPKGTGGAHSIELANDGHMWITMCASGQMAKFDIKTKKYTIVSSAESPAKRGSYPHTLRINPKDPRGLIWYTDAGRNSVFWLDPKTFKVKEYHLLSKNQAVAAGRGESRGITPYGLDYSPVDGMIWYSKLNGNRIGRINPNVPDGDIKEWNPPFRGPRRLHVAQDGIVWVPGFGSGVFAKFNPKTETWTVYELPDAENQIPYALNIDPRGFVWICGTGNDTLNRFDPKTETLVTFQLPTRVSYTREIEFDENGAVWTSTSGPIRHMERAYGSVIKLEIPEGNFGGGIKLKGRVHRGEHSVGSDRFAKYKDSPNGTLLKRIEQTALPKAYNPRKHQPYVDKRMAGLALKQRGRIGQLWKEKRRIDPNMDNAGHSFVKIMEYVAENEK